MRNLYQWFTKGLRYDDMAYNFLVDRYGRLYEGRGGGIDQPVIGGHTAGFNDDTFAVSAIGDFRTFRPESHRPGGHQRVASPRCSRGSCRCRSATRTARRS